MFRVKNTRATTLAKNTNISPALSHQQPLMLPPTQISNMNKLINPKPKLYNIHQVKKLQNNVPGKNDSANKDIISKDKLVQNKNNGNKSKFNVNANINSKIQLVSNNNSRGPNAGRNVNVNRNIGTFAITNNSKLANTLGSRKNRREDTLTITKTNNIQKQSKEFEQKVIRSKQIQIQSSVNIEQIKINNGTEKISKQQENQRPKHIYKQVSIQRSNQKQQQKQAQTKKHKQQQQTRKIELQRENQMKKLRKQQQEQQQRKRIEEAQAQIAKIMQRRKQRQQERSRMKQIQQKRQKQLKQLAQHLQQNHNGNTDINRGGMLYTNDTLAHFEFAQKIMNLQINKILKMSFHSFPSGQLIQRKKQELQRINTSYMMIRDDASANQRMKDGLNGYRTQLFNEIGEFIVNDQKQGYNNPNFRIMQSDHTNKISPEVVLTRGIPSHKISAILKPSIANTNQHQCSICLNDIQKQTKYYRLVCGHNFHIQCTEDWVSNTGNCPVCRKNLKF